MQINTEKSRITNLISSIPYWSSAHPDSEKLRNLMTDWFAKTYPANRDQAKEFNVPFFIDRIKLGNVLFVGEGNFSFSCALAQLPEVPAQRIVTSIYEDHAETDVVKENTTRLESIGAAVQYGVDATKLDQSLKNKKFHTIIFQFPNTGSRDPLYGHNSNFVLIRRFLKSAAFCLEDGGIILITAVDNPYYRGAFRFEDAAKQAGYDEPEVLVFNPEDFHGYSHVNTNNHESAIDDHHVFKTWVFARRKSTDV